MNISCSWLQRYEISEEIKETFAAGLQSRHRLNFWDPSVKLSEFVSRVLDSVRQCVATLTGHGQPQMQWNFLEFQVFSFSLSSDCQTWLHILHHSCVSDTVWTKRNWKSQIHSSNEFQAFSAASQQLRLRSARGPLYLLFPHCDISSTFQTTWE